MTVFCLASCVEDEDDIFGEAPAIRMQKAIADYKAILTDAPNGWILNYYPELSYGVGGFAVYCKFMPDGTVQTACEVTTKVAQFEIASSSWDIISYKGPTLTFDTYNSVIHYFSEVSSQSDRDGRAGDYDLVVTRAVADTVYLTGVKNELAMIMVKCQSDPIDYLKKTNAFSINANKFKTFNVELNGDSIGNIRMSTAVTNNLANRKFTYTYYVRDVIVGGAATRKDTTVTVPFYYTPDELVLQTPIDVGGKTLTRFAWDGEAIRYIGVEDNSITLKYVGAKIYMYEEFLGSYTMFYSTSNATPPNRTKSLDVTLTQGEEGQTYILDGILAAGSPAVLYARYVDGQLEIRGQVMYVDPATKYDLWWLPYSHNVGGNFTSRTTTYGVISDKIEENGGKFKFDMINNGVWSSYGGVAGFLIRNYNGSTNAGNVNGIDGQPYYFHLRFEKQ
jgi:hypothetical protein